MIKSKVNSSDKLNKDKKVSELKETQIIVQKMSHKVDSDATSKFDDHDAESVIRNITATPHTEVNSLTEKPEKKYIFKHSIAHGGMKSILKVRDKDTTRDIAMAVIRDPESSKNNIERFIQEARITSNLEHPNIVPIHDIGVDRSGSPYFTMKMIEGESLSTIIEKLNEDDEAYRKRYDLTSLLFIFRKICNAIAFAHSKGVIHLDLTPDNIQVGKFGEVLVLDWGLAKIIGHSKEDENESGLSPEDYSNLASYNPDLTMDGVIKGTPGYMAPEQAAGKNREKTKKTDIYALGAILYAILTCESPVEGENIDEVITKTVHGHIVQPKKRVPERNIPSALEAVIMKAMELNPADRYQNVIEVRDDIDAFISGFATSAERAGLLKRSFLLVKRHRLVSIFIVIILALIMMFSRYAMHEDAKLRGDWINIYQRDFTVPPYKTDEFRFMNRRNTQEVEAWSVDWEGLKMKKLVWMWLKDIFIQENFRVELKFICSDNPEALQVCTNSRIEPVKNWWHHPIGYSFQVGSNTGTKNLICKNEYSHSPDILNSIDFKMDVDKTNTITIERQGERLSIKSENNEGLSVIDLFPPVGAKLDKIGLRSFSSSIRLLSMSVSRLALPEKASPLIAGDSLVEAGHYEDAVAKYLTIAENYGESPIAEKAYVKAYFTAATKLTDKNSLLLAIKKRISSVFPNFQYWDRLLEVDALVLWRQKDFKSALFLLPEIFDINPDTRVVLRLLQNQNDPLPFDTGRDLLSWANKTTNLERLNLSNLGITSLEPIKDLSLTVLDCSNNPIFSVKPLQNMPLTTLDLSGCSNLRDITPLENIKTLEKLTIPPHLKGAKFLMNIPDLTINESLSQSPGK